MKKLISIIISFLLLFSLLGCNNNNDQPKEKVTFNIYSLKGPTSMGLIKFYDEESKDSFSNLYNCNMVVDASEVSAALINKSADIAALPANAAAVLFNKTNDFKVVAINTLGVLYIVENGNTINSIEDLENKTIYLTGKATTPEYALRYLLNKAGIEKTVTLEFKSEPTEVLNSLSENVTSIGLLPQPFVTTALMQNSNLRIALSLTEEWERYGDDSSLITGVTVVRNEILEKYPQQINNFLKEYNDAVNWVNVNNQQASELIAKLNIVPKAPIALKALPYCNIVCIQNNQMKQLLSGYLNTLFEANNASVGGKLPADDFYYIYE